jgi:hypothetical protein
MKVETCKGNTPVKLVTLDGLLILISLWRGLTVKSALYEDIDIIYLHKGQI